MLIVSLIGSHCYSQTVSGRVIDKITKKPVSNALVSIALAKAFTNNLGEFSIALTINTDTLRVRHFGYRPFKLVPGKAIILMVELEPSAIALKQVNIHANRDSDFVKDSINNRKEFAKQFDYVGPTIKDAFTGNTIHQPGELISVNPLTLIAALTKKSSPEYKFKKMLERDEQETYISRKFNRGIVVKITKLKGDTVSTFLVRYRPEYKFTKKATDYDMINYIRNCYKQFAKDGFRKDELFK